MFETLTITQTISVFLGLYLLSFGIGLMLERDNMSDMMKQFSENSALGFTAGVITFVIGALIVGLHQDYSNVHASVVSVIGWVILAKGMMIIAFRSIFMRLASNIFVSAKLATGLGIFTILIGIWMMSAI